MVSSNHLCLDASNLAIAQSRHGKGGIAKQAPGDAFIPTRALSRSSGSYKKQIGER